MSDTSIACFHCGAPMRAMPDADNADYSCPACGGAQRIWIFPAAARPVPEGQPGIPRADASLAPCQRHEHRLAEAACSACGIFLCRGCAIVFHGAPYCAECIHAAQRMRTAPRLVFDYTRWDTAALALALLPLMLFPIAGLVSLALRVALPDLSDDAFIPLGVAAGFGFMLALICGPASFFMGVFFRKWRFSAAGVRRWPMLLAGILALLEIAAIITMFLIVIYGMVENMA